MVGDLTTDAQKRAQARYDRKRPTAVLIRLLKGEIKTLDKQRLPGESRPAAIKRLLFADEEK